MNKAILTETARSRADLAIAIEDQLNVAEAVAASHASADSLLDLQVAADHADDMALVFSEHYPDGVVVPLSWVYQLERNSSEPVTVVRVSREMAQSVMEIL